MTKSETLSKLALIQKEIEQLELLQKEVDSFYFEETKLNGKIDTTNFKSAMSYFNITLDPVQTKLFVDSILKIKNEEYAKLFREIADTI
jgi:hypothetical protein